MTSVYQRMNEDQLQELTEQALREHEAGEAPFQPRGDETARTVGTVPISLRLPAPLLAGIKATAAKRKLPYQRLIKRWLEEALARNGNADPSQPVLIRLSVKQLAWLCESGSLDVHIEGPR
jgi:predicted DNA binding CopG/RHH family protein